MTSRSFEPCNQRFFKPPWALTYQTKITQGILRAAKDFLLQTPVPERKKPNQGLPHSSSLGLPITLWPGDLKLLFSQLSYRSRYYSR